MKLNGQCKEDFEKWVKQTEEYFYLSFDVHKCDTDEDFYNLPPSMQYGVLVDFFDSKEILIELEAYWIGEDRTYEYNLRTDRCYLCDESLPTRQEARAKAIEKANELYNEI